MNNHPLDEERAEILSAFIDKLNEGTITSPRAFADRSGLFGHAVIDEMNALMPLKAGPLYDSPGAGEAATMFGSVMRALSQEATPTASCSTVQVATRTDILILMIQMVEELYGSIWGNIKMMKLPFLLAQEGGCRAFVPDFYFPSVADAAYNFGAFDQNVLDDVDALVAAGIIRKQLPPAKQRRTDGQLGIPKEKQVDWIYELTPKGKKIADLLACGTKSQNPELLQKIREVVSNHGGKNMDQLLDYTYNKYPDSAIKSKVREKYLRPKNGKPEKSGNE